MKHCSFPSWLEMILWKCLKTFSKDKQSKWFSLKSFNMHFKSLKRQCCCTYLLCDATFLLSLYRKLYNFCFKSLFFLYFYPFSHQFLKVLSYVSFVTLCVSTVREEQSTKTKMHFISLFSCCLSIIFPMAHSSKHGKHKER